MHHEKKLLRQAIADIEANTAKLSAYLCITGHTPVKDKRIYLHELADKLNMDHCDVQGALAVLLVNRKIRDVRRGSKPGEIICSLF